MHKNNLKNNFILLTIFAVISAVNITTPANAFEFNNKLLGKANVSIGYNFQQVKSQDILNIEPDGNLNFHTLTLGGGFNVYYKLSHTIHPFFGLDIEGRVPLKTDVITEHYRDISGTVEKKSVKDFWKINDFISVHIKLGTQFNLHNNIAISPYGLIGFNILSSSSTGYVGLDEYGEPNGHSPWKISDGLNDIKHHYSLSRTYIGISTGIGVNIAYQINSYMAVFSAIEYQFHMVKNQNIYSHHHLIYDKYVGGDNSDEWTGNRKVNDYQSHQMSVKLGMSFM